MSSTNTPATPPAIPTERQMKLLSIFMQNNKSKPDIDWDQVVSLSGLKNKTTAKETYRQLQKKFQLNSPAGGAAAASGSPLTPTKVTKRTGKVGDKKPGPKGRGKKAAEQKEEAGEAGGSKGGKGKGKGIVKKEEEEEGDGEDYDSWDEAI